MNCLVYIDAYRLQNPLPGTEQALDWLQIQADHCIIYLVHASSYDLHHLRSIPNSASNSQHELSQKYSSVPLLGYHGTACILSTAEETRMEELHRRAADCYFVRN